MGELLNWRIVEWLVRCTLATRNFCKRVVLLL
jgi:hypothetical protein